jgi:very-short-patch-repair endonuclease
VHGGPQRVDGLIEPWRLIVEADGRRWHTRVADFERDHARDIAALLHGYLVARFTWSQLTNGHADCVAALREIGLTRAPGGVGSSALCR